jgi:hypothetical protein
MSRITVTIDKLVLRGVDPSNSKGLIEGLRAELSQSLSQPTTNADRPVAQSQLVMKLGRMPLGEGNAGGRKFGRQLARKITRGLQP